MPSLRGCAEFFCSSTLGYAVRRERIGRTETFVRILLSQRALSDTVGVTALAFEWSGSGTVLKAGFLPGGIPFTVLSSAEGLLPPPAALPTEYALLVVLRCINKGRAVASR